MPVQDIVRIPLRARDGSVRAYALVDASDADWINQWRWCLDRGGYAVRGPNIRMHRALLGLTKDDDSAGDHINRDRLDNRRSNLRAIPKSGNRQNKTSHSGSSSQYRGVSWETRTKSWMAKIYSGGKQINLGRFPTEEAAGAAAREARMRLMPYAVD